MTAEPDGRRVLLAVSPADVPGLRALFAQPPLTAWTAFDVDSLERAHFVLQHDPVDALLIDESQSRDDAGGTDWTLAPGWPPAVMLLTPTAENLASAIGGGAAAWLPRDVALACPRLLAQALDHVARVGDERRRSRQTGDALKDCQRRVNRLLGMLWENTPVEGRTGWYSQRHMLDRLQEELSRVARHGGQFSVVVGELKVRPGCLGPDETLLVEWVSDHIQRLKRRCDVLGHYGPRGFLLLLPHTTDAGAAGLCQRLRYSVEQTPPRPPSTVTLRLGSASCEDGRTSAKALLRRAEEQLADAPDEPAVGLVS